MFTEEVCQRLNPFQNPERRFGGGEGGGNRAGTREVKIWSHGFWTSRCKEKLSQTYF